MRLLHVLLFPAVIFLISSAHPRTHVERYDSGNTIQDKQVKLKDVHKREMFESGEKEKGNENHVVENFMFREHTPVVISSSILPLYRRTEFVVLSGGVVLYWITMIFIGTMLVMCCICSRSHDDDEEDEEIPKKKADEKTEEP